MNTIDNFRIAREFETVAYLALILRPSTICVVGRARESGCVGNSGGPLITEDGVLNWCGQFRLESKAMIWDIQLALCLMD